MAFDPKLYRDNISGTGMPADEKATDSTSAWTAVSLLKGIFGALTSGIVVTGAATAANQTAEATLIGAVTETAPANDTASSGLNGRLQRIAQRVTSLIAQLPASLGVKARTASISVAMATEDAALFPASLGAKTAANSFAVTLATDDPLTVIQSASTASVTTLASTAASQQLLAANTARKGLMLTNTDANAVLVKYGTTASASSFTVRITQNGYWEMPKPIYTGRIDAIWEADGSGSLIATEL